MTNNKNLLRWGFCRTFDCCENVSMSGECKLKIVSDIYLYKTNVTTISRHPRCKQNGVSALKGGDQYYSSNFTVKRIEEVYFCMSKNSWSTVQ